MSELPDRIVRRQFGDDRQLATRGPRVGAEPTVDGWRSWAPTRSKLAAMIELGMDIGLRDGQAVLYLGAAAGTTVSHVADVAGPTYAVEFATRPMRDLVEVAADRPNLFPLLKDARRPASYGHIVEPVDLLVQDVATRGQADVAVRNARYLSPGGRLALVVKSRSEDVTASPERVYERALEQLGEVYTIHDHARLDRFHEDHLAVVGERR